MPAQRHRHNLSPAHMTGRDTQRHPIPHKSCHLLIFVPPAFFYTTSTSIPVPAYAIHPYPSPFLLTLIAPLPTSPPQTLLAATTSTTGPLQPTQHNIRCSTVAKPLPPLSPIPHPQSPPPPHPQKQAPSAPLTPSPSNTGSTSTTGTAMRVPGDWSLR
jgi:hypothetical protein